MASIGDLIRYTLTADDAETANRRRVPGEPQQTYDMYAGKYVSEGKGRIIHHGSQVSEGDEFTAMVVRVNNHDDGANTVNLHVFLDGNDALWIEDYSIPETPASGS